MANTRITISLPAHAAEKLARMGSAQLTDLLGFDVESIRVLDDAQRRKRVNVPLYELGKTYHEEFPLTQVNAALHLGGFDALDEAAYSFLSGQGNFHQKVGQNTWLTVNWYTMPSGRLEVVAYVS